MKAGKSPGAADRAAPDGGARTRSGSGPSDAALVVAARAGEAWAQEALYLRYSRMVNGLAWRLMPGDPDVEDLVQDSFIQAFAGLARLGEPAVFSSWLGSIVVRQAHKRIRRKRLRQRLGLLRSEPVDLATVISADAPPDVAAELRGVYGVLQDLPAEERIALVLRRVEGRELADVAQHMGISLATVKRRLAAAEKRLAEALAERGAGEDA